MIMILTANLACAISINNALENLKESDIHGTSNFNDIVEQITYLDQHIAQFNDEDKMTFYGLASNLYLVNHPIKSKEFAARGNELAVTLDDYSHQVFFKTLLFELSDLDTIGTDETAIQSIAEGLDELNDSYIKALTYLIFARINNKIQNRLDQLSALKSGISILERIDKNNNNKNLKLKAEFYNDLGNFYRLMSESKKASQFLQMAFEIFTELNNKSRQGMILFNFGMLYREVKNYPLAIKNFEQVIKLKRDLKENFGFALANQLAGDIKFKQGDYHEALMHLNIAIPLLLELHAHRRLLLAYLYKSNILHALGEKKIANNFVIKSLELADLHASPIQKIEVYETAIKILDEDTHQELKNKIARDFSSLQKTVLHASKKDLLKRSEAEAALKVQIQQNQYLSEIAEIKQRSLDIERSSADKQKLWITALFVLTGFLVFSIWKQILVTRDKTLLANTDPLTGAMNRRAFFQKLHKSHAISTSSNQYYLMILDIDHFKEVNDQFGHSAGDVVLIEFINLLDSVVSKSNYFARIGGEEFAIVSSHNNNEEAIEFAQHIRKSIANNNWQNKEVESHVHVTASIGVEYIDNKLPLDDVVNGADHALYRAKRSGRNTVEPAHF